MTTAPAPAPAATTTGDDLDHLYCCDPDTALCGTDISDNTEADFEHPDCVVCADLEVTDVSCSPNCPFGGD